MSLIQFFILHFIHGSELFLRVKGPRVQIQDQHFAWTREFVECGEPELRFGLKQGLRRNQAQAQAWEAGSNRCLRKKHPGPRRLTDPAYQSFRPKFRTKGHMEWKTIRWLSPWEGH